MLSFEIFLVSFLILHKETFFADQTYQISSIRLESQAFGLDLKLSSLMVSISSILTMFVKKLR